jgi:hypothetical protein
MDQRIVDCEDKRDVSQQRQTEQVEPHVAKLQMEDIRFERSNLRDEPPDHLELMKRLPYAGFVEKFAFDSRREQMLVRLTLIPGEKQQYLGIRILCDPAGKTNAVFPEIKR